MIYTLDLENIRVIDFSLYQKSQVNNSEKVIISSIEVKEKSLKSKQFCFKDIANNDFSYIASVTKTTEKTLMLLRAKLSKKR